MGELEIVQYVLYGSMTGMASLIVSHIKKMSENLQKITYSVQELNSRIEVITDRMVQAHEVLKDHEGRIRIIEQVK